MDDDNKECDEHEHYDFNKLFDSLEELLEFNSDAINVEICADVPDGQIIAGMSEVSALVEALLIKLHCFELDTRSKQSDKQPNNNNNNEDLN